MYCHRTSIAIFFSILQLIYSDPDEEPYEPWNPYSALIQTQSTGTEKHFPLTVRISRTHKKKVYFDADERFEGIITYAMCPKPNKTHRLGRYCNYPGESFPVAKYYKGQTLNEICPMTVEPALEKIMIDGSPPTHEQCANGRGHRYSFVYYRCQTGMWLWLLNRPDLKRTFVYNACYDETQKQMVYGYYQIANPNLLTNPLLKGEREFKFEYQTKQYFTDFFNHFKNVSEYLYKKNEKYEKRMVLPPELLPFALMRKPLYHYMNLAPMDKMLIPDWEWFLKKLKDKIAQINRPVNVTAGLLDTLGDQYLGYMKPEPQAEDNIRGNAKNENDQVIPVPEIPIPNIWWILLYNTGRTHGVVIMMHNEPYNDDMNEKFYDPDNCGRSICYAANVASAIPKPGLAFHPAYIYCCHPFVITGKYKFRGQNNLLQLPN